MAAAYGDNDRPGRPDPGVQSLLPGPPSASCCGLNWRTGPQDGAKPAPVRGPKQEGGRQETMADSREKTLHKHVRIAPEQWERLERAAQGTPHSPNRILVELAMEALDRREWPSTEVEIRVARASLFTAQAIALDLIAAGREKEVQEIRDYVSTIVPDTPELLSSLLAHQITRKGE